MTRGVPRYGWLGCTARRQDGRPWSPVQHWLPGLCAPTVPLRDPSNLDGSSRSRDWWQSNRKEVHQKHSITPPFFTLTNSAERVIQYWYDILVFIGTFVLWIEFRLSVRCLPLWINFFLHACRISYPSLGLACLPHCRTSGQGGTQISGESCTRCHNVRPTRSKERRFPKC